MKEKAIEDINIMFEAAVCAVCHCNDNASSKYPCNDCSCKDTKRYAEAYQMLIEVKKDLLKKYS